MIHPLPETSRAPETASPEAPQGSVLDRADPPSIVVRGLLGGSGLTALLFLQQLALGRSPFAEPGEWSDVWVAVVHAVGAAYVPAAYLATLVSGRRAVRELHRRFGPVFPTPRVADLPPFAPPSARWILAGAIGCLLTFLGPWLTEPSMGGPLYFWAPARWAPEVWWHRVLGLWIGLGLGWFTLSVVQVSHRLSRLARELPGLDPFDPSPLRPFVRHGLSNGLTAAILAALLGLLGFDLGLTWMLVVFGGGSLALVAVALALPLLGVRDRLQAEKDAELAWCDGAIEEERARVRRGLPRGEHALSDLVAYRRLVERLVTWPLDLRTFRRASLYVLLPLASWAASAVVEALVTRWMGGE